MAFKKRMDEPKYHIVLKKKKKSDTMQYLSYNEFENNENKNINIKYYVSGIE